MKKAPYISVDVRGLYSLPTSPVQAMKGIMGIVTRDRSTERESSGHDLAALASVLLLARQVVVVARETEEVVRVCGDR